MVLIAPLIGREEQLESLRSFVDGIGSGPAMLVLEGEPGIGKTALWRAGIAAARERRLRVLEARAGEAEATLSFASVADLLDGVVGEVLGELPAPQRRALEVALLLAEALGPAPGQRAVAVGFLSAVRVLAGAGPLLVAVDDVQWVDAPSAAALAFLLRRLREEPVGFLLTRRLEGGGAPALGLDRLPPEVRLERLRLGPLSLAALQRLLRTRLELTPTRPLLRRVHATCRGNPLFALELGRALRERREPWVVGEPLPVRTAT